MCLSSEIFTVKPPNTGPPNTMSPEYHVPRIPCHHSFPSFYSNTLPRLLAHVFGPGYWPGFLAWVLASWLTSGLGCWPRLLEQVVGPVFSPRFLTQDLGPGS